MKLGKEQIEKGSAEIDLPRRLTSATDKIVLKLSVSAKGAAGKSVTFAAGIMPPPNAPVLDGPPGSGETVLSGTIVGVAPGARLELKILFDGAEKKPKSIYIDRGRGRFRFDAGDDAKPGAQDKLVHVVLVVDGVESPASEPVRVARLALDQPVVSGADVIVGAAKASVFFRDIDPAAEEAVVVVVAEEKGGDLRTSSSKLTKDQMAKGSADVDLPRRLTTAGDSVTIYMTVSAKNASGAESGEFKTAPKMASIDVTEPLREGDFEIKGNAGTGVERVKAFILGGAYSVVRSSQSKPDPCDTKPEPKCPDGNDAKKADLSQGRRQFRAAAHRIEIDPNSSSPDFELQRDRRADEYREVQEELEAEVTGGAFTLNSLRGLMAGQRVLVCQLVKNMPEGPLVLFDSCVRLTVESVMLDWGRARAFFSAGGVTSHNREAFQKVAPYAAFSLDLSFWNHLVNKNSKRANRTSQEDLFGNTAVGVSVHGFADARLTQASRATLAPGSSIPTLESDRAGFFQAGLYLPVRIGGMAWVYRGTQFSTFIGPLAKAGVTTIEGGSLLQTKTTKEAGKDAVVTESRDRGPAPFHGFGFRTGVMKYDLMGRTLRNRQISPDPQIYLDVTWGHNSLYRRAGETYRTDVTTERVGMTLERILTLEGRLKIPYLPAQIGIDLIYGARRSHQSVSDFRFIVGYRIDAAKALGRIFGDSARPR